ncbi:MAG: hypothetical protein R2942_18390 [Ignavibacteria bacterium]
MQPEILLTDRAERFTRTIDGGANWVQLTIPNSDQPLYDIDFVDIYTGWVFGGQYLRRISNIQKQQMPGVTWTSQTSLPISNNTISAEICLMQITDIAQAEEMCIRLLTAEQTG